MNRKIQLIRRPEVTEIAGDKVMIDFETGKYYMLKGPANDIWEYLEDQTTIEQVTDRLIQNYDVERETCRKAVEEFMELLEEKGFIRFDEFQVNV